MQNPDQGKAVKLLCLTLDNIAHRDESDGGVHFIQLYPLFDNPRIQLIPKVYKGHLFGLFLELKLITRHGGTSIRTKNDQKWNEFLTSCPYSITHTKVRTESGRSNIIQLSIPPLKGEEENAVNKREELNKEDYAYLNVLRKKFCDVLLQLNVHDDDDNVQAADTTSIPIRKRTLTDTANTDLSSDKLETIPNLSNKRICTHHVGTSGFKICAPSHVHIESVYVHKQGKPQLSEYKRENIAMRERIKVLEAIIDDRNVLNKKLTVLRDNAQKLNDEMARKSIDLAKSISASLSTQSALDVITSKLSKTEQRVSMLEEQVKVDDEKVKIGTMILNLPTLAKKWKGTWNARRYSSLAYTTVPGCSAKYLQMAIPMSIAAFFHDIDIAKYYNDKDLRFIENLTPCDKMLDECVYLNREYIFYRISTYFEKGAMGHLSYDKGEQAGLGQLVEVMAFNNRKRKLEPSWHDGIISIRIDTDGVNSNDKDIATKIIKTKQDIITYLEDGTRIRLASILTDHHGGGGGTMKSSAKAIQKIDDSMLHNLLFINNCMLHGLSKPLELAWLEFFASNI